MGGSLVRGLEDIMKSTSVALIREHAVETQAPLCAGSCNCSKFAIYINSNLKFHLQGFEEKSCCAEQWVDALVEWLGITEEQVHVTNTRKDTNLTGRKFQCLIASYNFLGNLEANDRDLDFRVVIMDEAHYIKNKKVGPFLSCCQAVELCSAAARLQTNACHCGHGIPVRMQTLTSSKYLCMVHACNACDGEDVQMLTWPYIFDQLSCKGL